jgi:cell fate (sporulation/competence/biofilm development) regulator YlbF (YheA/YmcA/DUF963 family)
MTLTSEETAVLAKTRELCQAILTEPEFLSVRHQIDSFMSNDQAKEQYQALVEKSEHLHHKQHQGVELSEGEVADFNRLRDDVLGNPVAKGFMDAQRDMQKMQEKINQYVSKTFELGRLPTDEDFDSGSCGSGCGCHH